MKIMKLITLVVFLSFLEACSQQSLDTQEAENHLEKQTTEGNAVALNNGFVSSLAANLAQDSNRKFIRTTDMKFLTDDVYKSSLAIEKLVIQHQGFITMSNLQSQIIRRNFQSFSPDSVIESTIYQVNNSIVARVPNKALNTVLEQISPLIHYLDYRIIKANDVTLDLKENELRQNSISSKQKKTDNIQVASGEKIKNQLAKIAFEDDDNQNSNQLKIDRLRTMDQIDMSTLVIHVYQNETAKFYKSADNESLKKQFEPNFFKQMLYALHYGFDFFKSMILFLLKIWPFLILFLAGWFGYKMWLKR